MGQIDPFLGENHDERYLIADRAADRFSRPGGPSGGLPGPLSAAIARDRR